MKKGECYNIECLQYKIDSTKHYATITFSFNNDVTYKTTLLHLIMPQGKKNKYRKGLNTFLNKIINACIAV